MSRLTGHSDAAASGASRGEGPAFFAPQPWNGGNQKQKGIFAWFRGGLWRVVRLSETPFPMFWVFRCGPVSVVPFASVARSYDAVQDALKSLTAIWGRRHSFGQRHLNGSTRTGTQRDDRTIGTRSRHERPPKSPTKDGKISCFFDSAFRSSPCLRVRHVSGAPLAAG